MIISRISLRPFPRMSQAVISSGCATTGSNSRQSRPILHRTSCHDRKSARGRRSPSVTEAVFSCTHRAGCVRARTNTHGRKHKRSENEDDEREAFIAYDPSPPAHMLKRLRLFTRFLSSCEPAARNRPHRSLHGHRGRREDALLALKFLDIKVWPILFYF